ncbi:hypothetical protein BDZ91DRAFT_759667 [Kalaharituber pfeilii]|nr:hypothetical protein BDZ91DRAFT_759667 [Kalaharituber pfeilii]
MSQLILVYFMAAHRLVGEHEYVQFKPSIYQRNPVPTQKVILILQQTYKRIRRQGYEDEIVFTIRLVIDHIPAQAPKFNVVTIQSWVERPLMSAYIITDAGLGLLSGAKLKVDVRVADLKYKTRQKMHVRIGNQVFSGDHEG